MPYGLLLLGLSAVVALIAWQGFAAVASVLATAGWHLTLLGAYYALPVVLAALSWRALYAPRAEPPLPALGVAAWIGLSVNSLLPVAQIGGEIVKARVIMRQGVTVPTAGATVVVDKTLQAGTQLLYGLIGLALLALTVGGGGFILPTALTAALFGLGIYGFYRLQRAGLFGLLTRLAARFKADTELSGLSVTAGELDAALTTVYRRAARLLAAALWRCAFRIAMAGEIWLALHLMGHPVSLLHAVILESLGHSIRSAAFAVPGGVGAQEGGFVLVGVALGLSPEVALALSLARRIRELIAGLPGLLTWQLIEGAELRRRRARRAARIESPRTPSP